MCAMNAENVMPWLRIAMYSGIANKIRAMNPSANGQ
jgi:hypothetical protein